MPSRTIATRMATAADEAAVGALLEAAYPVLMRGSYDEATLTPALEKMTRPNSALLASGTYYVAESPGSGVIGCGGWTRERPGDGVVEPGVGHLRHFGTHPDWARCGVGRAIYERCYRDARASGVTDFECYSSINAEPFYRSLGFASLRRIDVNLGHGTELPSILMQCSLCGRNTT